MKSIILTGRLTADPQVRIVGENKVKIADFCLANNDSSGDNAEFFDVCCWERTADFAEKHLKKGSKLLVYGTFSNETYKDKEDRNRTKFKITANKMEFME